MRKGFIRIQREIQESELMHDPVLLGTYMYLALNCKWSDSEFGKSGQVIIPISQIAYDLNISRNYLYKLLRKLESAGVVTREVSGKNCILRVNKFLLTDTRKTKDENDFYSFD